MIDEKQMQLEEERKQRVADLLAMRELDKKFGLEKHEVTNPLVEINLRVSQYIDRLPKFSLDFIILQALQDFRQHYVVLQVKTLNREKPVCILRNEKHTKIYVARDTTKEALKEQGGFCFVREEFFGEPK